MCGGTGLTTPGISETAGLSPRVRGNPEGPFSFINSRGSIPACAGEPGTWCTPPACPAVYPRVCGGTATINEPQGGTEGLSPRVRGNRPASTDALTLDGSIPACAGEPGAPTRTPREDGVYPRVCGGTHTVSVSVALHTWQCPVYPRVCGGTIYRMPVVILHSGLSPRVRGNPKPRHRIRAGGGSIPACAGEPVSIARSLTPGWVYPRVCGGTTNDLSNGQRGVGLSPRVRGNRLPSCL